MAKLSLNSRMASDSDSCDAVLIQNVSFTSLDTFSQLQYLSIIDQETWDTHKTDASFLGSVNDLMDGIPPLTASASYDQFAQDRSRYFASTQFSSSNQERFIAFRQYITSDQANAWVACKAANAKQFGPQILATRITANTVALELFWVAPPGFGSTSVDATGTISGGTTIGQGDLKPNQLLPDDFQLNNQTGQAIQVTRDPNVDLVITLSASPTGSADYSLRSPTATSLAMATPVGTIVPSMLPPSRYFDATQESPSVDLTRRAWVPADGRPVPGSTYVQLIGPKVPDLRGVFLRCVNFMEADPTVPALDPQQQDPNDSKAGDFKPDVAKKHRHNVGTMIPLVINSSNHWVEGDSADVTMIPQPQSTLIATDDPDGYLGAETAPKHRAVYYYVRIN